MTTIKNDGRPLPTSSTSPVSNTQSQAAHAPAQPVPANSGWGPRGAPAAAPKSEGFRPPNLSGAPAPRASAPVSTQPVALSPEQKGQVAVKKGTCPFIGTAVATGSLPVRNSADKPLGSVQDVVALGNTGGGDLGKVLELFAQGNHGYMPGGDGRLDQPVPQGTFSLDLPGSQGSHPGHSGILQGNPLMPSSGRFSDDDFNRLLSKAKDGYIKRSDVGKFIAENCIKDPNSKVAGLNVAGKLATDVAQVAAKAPGALLEKIENKLTGKTGDTAQRAELRALTKTLGEDNLSGSAGEFGLLFAFLANKPGAKTVDGEPAISVQDLNAMFKDKQFPPGWETWPKNASDWVKSTTALTASAAAEYARLKLEH